MGRDAAVLGELLGRREPLDDEVAQHPDELRRRPDRRRPLRHHPRQRGHLLLRLGVEVVEHLDVVAGEADRHHDHLADAVRVQLGDAVADVGLDPTVAYMQGKLKATGPTHLLFDVLKSGEAATALRDAVADR